MNVVERVRQDGTNLFKEIKINAVSLLLANEKVSLLKACTDGRDILRKQEGRKITVSADSAIRKSQRNNWSRRVVDRDPARDPFQTHFAKSRTIGDAFNAVLSSFAMAASGITCSSTLFMATTTATSDAEE